MFAKYSDELLDHKTCSAQNIWRFDYAGIVVLIVTSFVPVVYYSFLCNPACQYFYLISTVALGEPAEQLLRGSDRPLLLEHHKV